MADKLQNRTRSKQIILRLTEKEFSVATEKMKQTYKKNRADFFMLLISSKPIVVLDGLPEITAELKRQGNNLNQIARQLNQHSDNFNSAYAVLGKCREAYATVVNFIEESRTTVNKKSHDNRST